MKMKTKPKPEKPTKVKPRKLFAERKQKWKSKMAETTTKNKYHTIETHNRLCVYTEQTHLGTLYRLWWFLFFHPFPNVIFSSLYVRWCHFQKFCTSIAFMFHSPFLLFLCVCVCVCEDFLAVLFVFFFSGNEYHMCEFETSTMTPRVSQSTWTVRESWTKNLTLDWILWHHYSYIWIISYTLHSAHSFVKRRGKKTPFHSPNLWKQNAKNMKMREKPNNDGNQNKKQKERKTRKAKRKVLSFIGIFFLFFCLFLFVVKSCVFVFTLQSGKKPEAQVV